MSKIYISDARLAEMALKGGNFTIEEVESLVWEVVNSRAMIKRLNERIMDLEED